MIYLRADANSTIGSGHVMRCLSVAEAFRERGVDCTFITADHNADAILQDKGVNHICLGSKWDALEDEIPKISALLNETQPSFMIVDHYYVTPSYLTQLRKITRLVYIDDQNAFVYPCDILVNYNVFALNRERKYLQQYRNCSTKLLLGPHYAPLRREFVSIPRKTIRDDVEDVLISTGGADPVGMGQSLLCAIEKRRCLNNVRFHLIVGALNSYREEIEQKATAMQNIELHFSVKNMSNLMQQCDAAISAAGSTLYELCACGVPTITYVLADNQIPGADGFEGLGLMLNAGDCREDERIADSILDRLETLMTSQTKRKEISCAMQKCVTGNGAQALVDEMLNCYF